MVTGKGKLNSFGIHQKVTAVNGKPRTTSARGLASKHPATIPVQAIYRENWVAVEHAV
jgi:hypothetical protein